MQMKSTVIRIFIASLFLTTLVENLYSDTSGIKKNPPLVAHYDKPAETWESEALPIGNAYMGAMIFGGVDTDVIQTNENTVWAGGPGENPEYNGGHLRTAQENRANLQKARKILQEKANEFSAKKYARIDSDGKLKTWNYDGDGQGTEIREYIDGIAGDRKSFGSYQTLGNIEISDAARPIIDTEKLWSNFENINNREQQISMLFDKNSQSKWYSEKGNINADTCVIKWSYSVPFNAVSYTLTSAEDVPGRDPKAWKLYGSRDGKDKSYVLLDEQNGIFWPEKHAKGKENRNTAKTFPVKANGYKYFKLEISELVDNTQKPQLAEISLDSPASYSDYRRELDIDNAVCRVSYTQKDATLTREYFMSYPDNVMVVKMTANNGKRFSRIISLTTPHSDKSISAEGNSITMLGYPTPVNGDKRVGDNWKNGLKFAQVLQCKNKGGTIKVVDGSKIKIEGATEIILLMSAATNYDQCMDDSFNYFSAVDPLDKVNAVLKKAEGKSYAELLETHVSDYRSLFGRMNLNLGSSAEVSQKTTDELLKGMNSGTNTPQENRFLETLYFQFGRYLLIASSREGTLPANLQGVWADKLRNPWNADYHTNINVQMNYWPAQATNLADCHTPLIKYINSLVPRGRKTAQYYYCTPTGGEVRGWVTHHENNTWGHTAPANKDTPHHFPAGAIWLCQDIWEYYQFNQDVDFLEKNYATMLDAALFWVDTLWTDERDGSLVANPSHSPEHGNYSLGCSTSQAMVWEMFDMTLKAAAVLNKEKTSEIGEIKNAMSKLSGPKIGLGGQFMEWKDEVTIDVTGDGHHRHVNHLFWLHPGSRIVPGRSDAENKFSDAMKKTLNTRGDDGVGWSKAWKINFWARLKDGNRAHELIKTAMHLASPKIYRGGVYPNLFDACPPFQIDGNFGFTAGVSEMLLQSHGGYIEVLPALPDAWKDGSFQGMKARGNFEVSAAWKDGKITRLEIVSHSGGELKIKYSNISSLKVNGEKFSASADNPVSLKTEKGGKYIFQ